MSFLERLQLASEEGWGATLYIIVAFFAALILTYGMIASFRRKKSLLSAKEQEHLNQSLKLLKPSFNISAKRNLGPLGTQVLCKNDLGIKTFALVPLQLCSTPRFFNRMDAYCKVMNEEVGSFTKLNFIEEGDKGVITQEVDQNQWISLQQYLMDREISLFERETLLLQIALALGSLHMIDVVDEDKIYHGYINPNTILIDLDERECIQRICIKDHGILWALDEALWIESMKRVDPKKGISHFNHRLIYSAPELIEGIDYPTAAVDFYSYGLLVNKLFGVADHEESNEGESSIPKRWRSFVKKCLSKNPKERPQDFLELDDLLNDPEINAHFEEVEKKQEEMGSDRIAPLKNARDLFMKLRDNQASHSNEDEDVNPIVDKGFTFLRNRQWIKAISYFKELEKESPSPRILLGLAIGLHQKGERDQAEEVYMNLKEKDPSLVSEFHSFLAKGF